MLRVAINIYYVIIYKKLKKFEDKGTYYKLGKDGVYIMPKQVFYPCVNMPYNLTLVLQEYQFLCDCV